MRATCEFVYELKNKKTFTLNKKTWFAGLVEQNNKYFTCTHGLQAQYEQDIRIAEMQTEMVEFDNKIFELVCEKDELETRLKFAEISAILLYEEFQVVNQDQVQLCSFKSESHLEYFVETGGRLEGGGCEAGAQPGQAQREAAGGGEDPGGEAEERGQPEGAEEEHLRDGGEGAQ